jgi:hypothetical protein
MENSSLPMANLAKLQEEMEGYCGLGMYDEALHVLDSIRIHLNQPSPACFIQHTCINVSTSTACLPAATYRR